MAKHWTPHDFDAHSDPKIIKLLSKYGFKGYGWYWRIIEMMGMDTSHVLQTSDTESIAYELRAEYEDVQGFICFCILHDLFESEPPSFWSSRLIKEMDKYDEIVEKRKVAGSKGGKQKASNSLASAKQEDSKPLANTIQQNTTQQNRIEHKEGEGSQQSCSPHTEKLLKEMFGNE